MTAPGKPLVEVIAQVLNEHQPAGPPFRDLRPRCACGDWVGSELAMYTERTAHQARAVLAAISEAGTVEVQFGLDFGDEVSQQDTLEDVRDERGAIVAWIDKGEVTASDYGPLAPVTRTIMTHVGPWTAVEG